MNFKFFLVNGIIGLILLFCIQCMQFVRGLFIQSGLMDGSVDKNLFATNLIVVPAIFLILSVVFLLIWLYKDLRVHKL